MASKLQTLRASNPAKIPKTTSAVLSQGGIRPICAGNRTISSLPGRHIQTEPVAPTETAYAA